MHAAHYGIEKPIYRQTQDPEGSFEHVQPHQARQGAAVAWGEGQGALMVRNNW